MITRAYCHRQAVRLWDENGVTFGFDLQPGHNGRDLKSPARHAHSESECKPKSKAKSKGFSACVLPADFRL